MNNNYTKTMEKRYSRLLMAVLMLMSILPASIEAKVRVAPEAPDSMESLTPVDGQYYVLYHPARGAFMSYIGNNVVFSGTPTLIRIDAASDNNYHRLRIHQRGNYYLYYSSSNNADVYNYNTSSNSDRNYWYSFVSASGGYKLRQYYSNSYYPGWSTSESFYVRTQTSADSVVWRFLDGCYGMRLRLYPLLQQAEESGYNVDKYDAIYEDSTQTAVQLYNAYLELARSIELSNALTKPSWNEYPMLFTRTGAWWKIRNGYPHAINLDYGYNSYWNDWSYVTSYSSDCWVQNYNSNSAMTQWDLPMTVEVDENAIFRFGYYCNGNYKNPRLSVIVDDELKRQIFYSEGHLSDRSYLVELTPGVHTIILRFERDYGSSSSTMVDLYNFGVKKLGDEISVNLLEAGSLGTEVLYHVDNVNMVKRLKIKGPINDEDWNRIYMMTQLNSLDLSECTISEIKASQLSLDTHGSLSNLTTLKLPATLKTIGDKAFYRTNISGLDFPEGLETIGDNAFTQTGITKALLPQSVRTIGAYAFSECRSLKEVFLPDSVSVGTYAFNNCGLLKTANLPKNMVNVPAYMFYNCVSLDTMAIGDKIETIGDYAFYYCSKMKMESLPSTVRTINQYAFCNCDSLKEFTLPEGLTSVGQYAFAYSNYFHTPIPSTLKTIATHAFENAFKLDTIRIVSSANVAEQAFLNCREARTLVIGKSATIGNNAFQDCTALDSVVIGESVSLGTTPFNNCTNLRYIEFPTTYYTCSSQQLANITGEKLEKVVFKSPTMIQGSAYTSFFSGVNTTNMKIYVPSFQRNNYRLDSYWYNWPIESLNTEEITDWTINQPITFGASERFGEQANVVFNQGGSLKVNGDTPLTFHNLVAHRNGNSFSMLLSNCDDVSISGTYSQRYYTAKNTWNFITLPFDFRVSDVTSSVGAQMVMRYYDGAHRAASGTGGNWKNLPVDSIVPAGSGIILMTSKDGWVYFNALDNAQKQNVVANHQLAKALEANPSETSSNKGWNMVGNMWLTYYNNHKLNFTAPITVWTGSTYKAYSLIDDDYALRPMEAFFVQCPDAVDVISFPTEGRQLTSVIESQNAARGNQSAARRFLVDLVLSEDSIVDETRVVINNQASLDYEMTCDASKFMTLDTQTAQLWSVCNGVNYAINERPLDDAVVRLGFTAPHEGQYTLSLKRNQAGRVLLTDRLMGTETDLSVEDYVFSADAGTTDVRFELHFDADNVTDIVVKKLDDLKTEVYTIDGRRVGFLPANGQLPKGVYVLRRGSVTEKVRY